MKTVPDRIREEDQPERDPEIRQRTEVQTRMNAATTSRYVAGFLMFLGGVALFIGVITWLFPLMVIAAAVFVAGLVWYLIALGSSQKKTEPRKT